MGVYVYVGNLGRTTTEDSVRAAFEAGGRAVQNVVILRTPRNDRSRGFGFVELGSVEEAAAAIQTLDGVEIEGRRVRVGEARERPPVRTYGRSFEGFRGPRRKSSRPRPR